MKKTNKTNKTQDIIDEYDFTDGVRGKYAKKYRTGNNVVLIEPELSELFPTSESVNKALRLLLELANNSFTSIKSKQIKKRKFIQKFENANVVREKKIRYSGKKN